MPSDTVNIQPGVNVLSVLRHLNYKPWYALGEFVDNAVQSALERWEQLQELHGGKYRLKVEIELDPNDGGRITVRDNAAGIAVADYQRAFRTAEVPPNRKGLSEFGMGMKSAGFWFSSNWSVRTKALGEERTGRIDFDLGKITADNLEELPVNFSAGQPHEHFTELILAHPQKMPAGRTISKIKSHLTGIYRQFIRDGRLELRFRGDLLTFPEPPILNAPHPKTPNATPVVWRKEIDLTLTGGKRAHGFVAIREEASVAEAGLALFRRNRLIVGSGDEGYRPESIFGQANDYRYQRVFGELHLEGFSVSHTKDGFQWEELEDEFQLKLKDMIDSEPLPILAKAKEHRVRPKTSDIRRGAETAVSSTAAVLQTKAASVIQEQRDQPPENVVTPLSLPPAAETAASKQFILDFKDQQWDVTIELANDPAIGEWLGVSDQPRAGNTRVLKLRLNCGHPFMERFAGSEAEQIEPLLRIAAAMAIAEIVTRDQGYKNTGAVRRHVNELLASALSSNSSTP